MIYLIMSIMLLKAIIFFSNKKIVFSGFRDKNLTDFIESIGGEIANSVSKNTFVVLVTDLEQTSTKIDQAAKIGIPIMKVNDFKLKYLN